MAPARNDLATPEHLDRVLYVTTPQAWLALCVLLAMTVAVVVWAIVGEVASYVQGDGIVLSRGGAVLDVASSGGGELVQIVPSLGDAVTRGEVVAEIYDEEIMERYASALALEDQQAQTLREREAGAREENELAEANLAGQYARLEELERIGRELVETARERLQGDWESFEAGLVAREVVEESEQAVDVALGNLFDVMRRRADLDSADLRRRSELEARLVEARADLVETQRQVRELAALIETWSIRAPGSGRVTEIKAQAGTVLTPGQSVIGIDTGGEGLDVLIYLSPADGKRIIVGLPALVSPATVQREEFGSMTGTVESISEFPESLDSMTAVLQNQELARAFLASGPPYSGRIALTLDSTTVSGFAWTSANGAEVEVTAGTLVAVEIEVDRRPPITLVIPLIRGRLGL